GELVAKPPDITQLPPQDAVFTRRMGAAGIVRADYPGGKAVQVASCLLEKIRNAIDTFFTEQKEDLEAAAGRFPSIGKPFGN
ncbi:hypothetical protein, partial [Acinetobacter johnsonii]|uniref:hypothetical protein n=1 Tax=Acinetobacter johnsonii TaxID=40214 RepID=UPI001F457CB2